MFKNAYIYNKFQDDHFVRFLIMSLRKENGMFKWRFDAANLSKMVQNGFINQINVRKPFSQGKSLLIHGEYSEFVRYFITNIVNLYNF